MGIDSDITAASQPIDWERRAREDRMIAAQLAPPNLPLARGDGYQDDSGAHWEYEATTGIPVYRCDDGRRRGQSLAAARRGVFELREVLTFRGGAVGGAQDVAPVGRGGDLMTLAQLVAPLVGGPASAVLAAVAGKDPATMTVAELLTHLGVRR